MSVSEMSSEDRSALVKKIVDCAKEHGLSGTVDVYREDVTVLMAGAKETNMRITYAKKYGPDMKEKVEAAKTALSAIVEGTGAKIDLGV